MDNLILVINRKILSREQTDLFQQYFFLGTVELKFQNVIISFFTMMLFSAFFGTCLYEDIKPDGIYFFLRQKSRKHWYIKKFLKQITFAGIAAVLISFADYILTYGTLCGIKDTKTLCIFFLQQFIVEFSILMFLSLLQNYISFFIGATYGFFSIIFLTIVELLLAVWSEEIGDGIIFFILNCLNPFTNYINVVNGNITFICSTVAALIIVIILMLLGYFITKKFDVGLSNKELQ